MWERRGLDIEGERLGRHQLSDDGDGFLLLDDVANATSVFLEQSDDGPPVLVRDPREAERLELGQEIAGPAASSLRSGREIEAVAVMTSAPELAKLALLAGGRLVIGCKKDQGMLEGE
jgi:hypothetical protein